jgi:hypothetical protein
MFRKKKQDTLQPGRRARERALTLPLPGPNQSLVSKIQSLQILGKTNQQTTSQKTCDQSHSILFTLPFEIRQMIWKEVLGGDVIHIIPLRDGLGHVRCIDSCGEKWNFLGHRCWVQHFIRLGLTIPPVNYPQPQDIPGTYPSLLPILKTCRQM